MHKTAELWDPGEGTSLGKVLDTPYISPLDGFSQHVHHVFPFTVGGLEAFGPANENSLKEKW